MEWIWKNVSKNGSYQWNLSKGSRKGGLNNEKKKIRVLFLQVSNKEAASSLQKETFGGFKAIRERRETNSGKSWLVSTYSIYSPSISDSYIVLGGIYDFTFSSSEICFAEMSGIYLNQLNNIFYNNVIKDILLYLK